MDDPTTVADRMLSVSEALGGISRIALQMRGAHLAHAALVRGIELLGSQVDPLVRTVRA